MDSQNQLSDLAPQESGQDTLAESTAIEAPADSIPADNLTVIALGASAGGLAALRTFFNAMPHDTGLTFVVVVHLSPEHESVLAELLQGFSPMPVSQVQARVKMEPNHVYVIPPGKRLVVIEGHLDLADFEMPHGRRLQIDAFFRSLAEQHGDGAAIVLSGTGSDGALGIQSIKEQGGIVLVQSPDEAEYDGMPNSAIATGLVDIVAPVKELVVQLIAAKRIKASLQLPANPDELSTAAQQTLIQLMTQLRMRTGHDFNGYKRTTILRRVARRMQLAQLDTLSAYLNRLRQDGEEVDALYRDLLIHVTEYFRDPASWQYLKEEIIPQLFAGKSDTDTVRVWTVGCATGEEAYGIAMLLMEHANILANPPQMQIFASDLGKLALDFAREGIYPEAIAANVSAERLQHFFVKDNSHFRVRPEVRERVLFAPHNLLQDPPFSRLDLIICRNLLIYLQRPLQERIFDSFYYALRAQGYLFLGSAETIDGATELFNAVDKHHRLYQRSQRYRDAFVLPTLPHSSSRLRIDPTHAPLQPVLTEAERHRNSLEELGLPSLLVDENYNILHYSETVGRFLQHPAGKPTNDASQLVRPELQTELRLALHRAITLGTGTRTPPVPIQFNGAPHPVTVFVRPAPQQGRVLLLFFEDEDLSVEQPIVTTSPTNEGRTDELQTELHHTQQRLQAMGEEYETTVEELRASNEELQSTNEEYRSTLEELETSKEELQSINEELQSVNQEMRGRVDEVSQANSDLQNLFAATEIATLFLDRELRVKRYTPRAAALFNLMPTDRGRPIGHLRHTLVYNTLEADAQQVLATLIPIEHEVKSEEGHWFLVGIHPYRTLEDKIDGIVLTCVDITSNKLAAQALLETQEYADSIVQTMPESLLVLDTNLRIKSANDAFYAAFQVQPEESEGQLIYELGNKQWDIPGLRQLLENILPENKIMLGYEVDHYFERIGQRAMRLNARQLEHNQLILLTIEDITQHQQAEQALRVSEERLRVTMMSILDHAIITLDSEGGITGWNVGAEQIFGYGSAEALGQPFAIIFTPEDRQHAIPEAAIEQAQLTGRAADERWCVRKDGSRFYMSSVLVPLLDSRVSGYVTVAHDLTERRQMEERLEVTVMERTVQVRDLVTQLTMSEQEERRRISGILHDDLQQRLFSLIFQLHTLRDDLESNRPQEVQQTIAEIEEALQTLVQITRDLSVDLSPPILHNEGLVEAIQWLAHRMEQQHGLIVEVRSEKMPSSPNEDLRVLLFQIVRELLFNVVKHAKVHTAKVTLTSMDGQVRIEVNDEGQGFGTDTENGSSQGLQRIEQRLQLLGGRLEITSAPGQGTRIMLYSPLQGRGKQS